MFESQHFDEFVSALEMIDDEDLRFEYIIDVGKKNDFKDFPEDQKVEKNLMHGCMSKVWIIGSVEDKKLYFKGYSDAIIVRGLAVMMTASFSGLTNEEVQSVSIEEVKKLNLGALTTQRQVGMLAMLEHLKKLGRLSIV